MKTDLQPLLTALSDAQMLAEATAQSLRQEEAVFLRNHDLNTDYHRISLTLLDVVKTGNLVKTMREEIASSGVQA